MLKTGETIVIAKHGVLIAHLTPIPSSQRADVSAVIQDLRSLRQEIALNGLSVKEMIGI